MSPKSRCILLLLLIIMHLTFLPDSVLSGNETDLQSLLAFKAQITDDPFGVLSSWNQSLHFCQWSGVTCSRRHQRVVELDLSSSQLQGSLSLHVGNLSFLRTLDLQNNSFIDNIPQEVGHLFRLRYLFLNNNSFSGVIPANISRCSNLASLILEGNSLTGKIPEQLGTLSKLEFLSLSRNNLGGEIPTSFGNLSSIQVINGIFNHFEGGIPASFGQLNKLYQLTLDRNNLTGTIPPSIYNLSSLTVLSLGGNQLHGTLSLNIGLTLPQLQYFNIASNKFSGKIPVTISNTSHLSDLQLSTNSFTGKMPTMAGLNNLRFLQISANHLGNGEDDDLSFLYSLANNTNLEILQIQDNNFGGELPEIVSNFSTNLKLMGFGKNQIRGNIPTEIGNLIGLETLGLEQNQLTGIIPTSIVKLQKLKRLTMPYNKISGAIPFSLGNITSLITLHLRQNALHGRIPSSLENCRNLLGLTLGDNKLSGPIPEEVLGISSLTHYLDLSGNQLTGSLPMQVGKLVNLAYLDVSGNKLSGEIPSTLASCISLEGLYLGGNFFQGTIPAILGAIKAIQYLNVSNNNLTGQIPSFLGDFKLLESLDLSFNGFEGKVPVNGVFANASKISIIGNKNLCGGIPQLNLPKCFFTDQSNRSESSTKSLLIVPIVSGCLGLIFMICFLLFCYFRKTRNELQSDFSFEKCMLRLTYRDLHQATNGFSSSNLIGAGSFGSVYKGILQHNGMVVAVKVLNRLHEGTFRSFVAECKAWTYIRHRNLVKILTACSSIDFRGNDFKALVYEFMINGSLDEWLHHVDSSDRYIHEPRNLNLLERLNIVVDVASALDYLHNHCQLPIIHSDLKPSNVLLDGEMNAHVGDFGISRFLQETPNLSSQNQSNSLGLRGSIGYAAPEYGMESKVSTYGDVYSFGILLLEMFTGKRPTDSMFKDGMNLHNFAEGALTNRVQDIMDPTLIEVQKEANLVASDTKNRFETNRSKYLECVISVLKVGVACSAELPRARMDISTAAAEVHRIRDILFRTESNM